MVQPPDVGVPPAFATGTDMSGAPLMIPGPDDRSVAGIDALIQKAGGTEFPTIGEVDKNIVTLPGGWISPDGTFYNKVHVRELTGYDEERMAKLDAFGNVGKWVTEILTLGVEDMGAGPPTRDDLKSLLIGDRDALIVGIRQVTYGNEVKIILTCTNCGEKSEVGIFLDEDVKTKTMEEPERRVFEVPLKRGVATVKLITGADQERLGDATKLNVAETNTLLLSCCVLTVNGNPVLGNDEAIRRLVAVDRKTLIEFIMEHQPGPQLGEISAPCATCGQEWPISLGLGDIFRV